VLKTISNNLKTISKNPQLIAGSNYKMGREKGREVEKMPVNVIVGGQYGSEGKGKVTAFLAGKHSASIVVRCGGPNSGHTVQFGAKRTVLRHLPAGFHLSNCRLLIPSGAYLDVKLLLEELEDLQIPASRVGISPNAGIICLRHKEQEADLYLRERIGSTLSGTGAAVSERILRSPHFQQAKDLPELQPFLTDVSLEVTEAANKDQVVLIEGTQGIGLSVLHSTRFPNATSRDTTASGFCSEVGISPRLVTDVTVVFRTYPIRVGGNSGPLKDELSWDELTQRAGAPELLREYTSVTATLRRVAEFDLSLAKEAIQHNLPTCTVLNHIDYVNFDDYGKVHSDELSQKSRNFITGLEERLGVKFDIVGTGPDHKHVAEIAKTFNSQGLAAVSA